MNSCGPCINGERDEASPGPRVIKAMRNEAEKMRRTEGDRSERMRRGSDRRRYTERRCSSEEA